MAACTVGGVTVSHYSSWRLRWETASLSTRLLLSVHTWTLRRPPSSSLLWTCSQRCHGNGRVLSDNESGTSSVVQVQMSNF